MADIRGLIEQSPTIGWGLALGTLAVLYYGDDLVRYYLSAMQQPF